MRASKASVLVILGALFALPAYGADFAQPKPVSFSSPETWRGAYVTVGAGRSSLDSRLRASPGSDPASPGISGELSSLGATGFSATIGAGYDYRFNQMFVVGAFSDYTFHDLNTTLNLAVAAAPLNVHGEVSVDRQWSIGARLGFLPSATTLVFVSAGYTELKLSDFTASVSSSDPLTTLQAKSPKAMGAFIGAGIETVLIEHWSLKAEYRNTLFREGDVTLTTIDGTNVNNFVQAYLKPTLQTVTASVGYRF